MVALAGIDALAFLNSQDGFEVAVAQAVARRVFEIRQLLAQNQAVLIANAVWKGFSG